MTETIADFQSWADRLPPHNLDAEEALLGCILLDSGTMSRVKGLLCPEAFFLKCHEDIYRAALAVHASQPVNLMTVTAWLYDHQQLEAIGGQRKLAALVDRTVSSVNADIYAQLVADKYYRRQIIQAGHSIAQLGHEEWVSQESLSSQIENKLLGKKGVLRHLKTEDQRSKSQYNQMVADIEHLELTVEDSGFKIWQYQKIATKFGTSVNRLKEIWHSHLINKSVARLETLEEIQAAANEVLEWILHGILPKEGLILMHAPGGCGKTRLFYDWAFCVATGQPWNGIFSVTAPRRKVLLVQTDESATEMYIALDTLGFNQSHNLRFLRNWSVENTAGLKKAIDEFDPDLILIDSLNSVSPNCLISENDAEYARPVLALRRLSEMTGKNIFLIHHSNKEGDVRGSSAIKAACSMEMKLSRDPQFPQPDSGRRIFTIGKTRCYRRPSEYAIDFDPETGKWDWLGEASKQETGEIDLPLKEKIVNFLSTHRNQRFEYEELHQELGGGLHSIRRAACQLASDGIISRARRKDRRSVFFLSWEGEKTIDMINSTPMIIDDHIYDHSGNAHRERDTGIRDHVIMENGISDMITEAAEKPRSHDHKENSEAQKPRPQSDSSYDHSYDHAMIIHDRVSEGEATTESSSPDISIDSSYDQSCDRVSEIRDREVENRDREVENCDRDREISPEVNGSLQSEDGKGDRETALLETKIYKLDCHPGHHFLCTDSINHRCRWLSGPHAGIEFTLDNEAPFHEGECLTWHKGSDTVAIILNARRGEKLIRVPGKKTQWVKNAELDPSHSSINQ